MKLLFFHLVLLFENVRTDLDNNFIFDYFNYKNAPSIVGYSCNSIENNIYLIKILNERGISISLTNTNIFHELRRSASTKNWKLGIFLDLRCLEQSTILEIFSEAAKNRMYGDLHYWLIISQSLNDATEWVDNHSLSISTDLVIAVPSKNSSEEGFILYDVYNIWKERGGNLSVTFFGFWNSSGKIKVYSQSSKNLKRANYQQLTLKTSFFSSKYKPPNMTLEDYLQDYSSSPKDGLSKFGFNLIKHLTDLYNFSLVIGDIGKWEVGDRYGPILRALAKDQIDLTGSPATMNTKRTYLVKYLFPAWPFRTCFLFRNPQRKNIAINEVLGPLATDTWYLSLVIFLLSSWILATVFKYENINSTILRYSESIVVIIGALCQQGTEVPMKNVSTRIAFFHIMMFSYLFYNYYSASIVSARLNEPISKINDSLNELSKLNMKLASEWMVYFELFIKKMDWDIQTFYNKTWSTIPEAEQFMLPEKAMHMVKNGGFAYHAHPDVSYPFVNRFFSNKEICELMEVHLAQPTFSTFAVSRNSTLSEILKIGFVRLSEVGLRKRQLLRWTSVRPRCQKSILNASSINIFEFAPHLIILLLGMAFAFGILIFEKVVYNFKIA